MHNVNDLRSAFSLFATGVVIVTTTNKDYEEINILTVNSLSSVSLDPALLLFCIDNKSSKFNAFKENKNFAVNILSQEQIEVSRKFSQKNPIIDTSKEFSKSTLNNLILKNSLAYFECEKDSFIEAGDHHIVLGRIVNFGKTSKKSNPLIYYNSNYHNNID